MERHRMRFVGNLKERRYLIERDVAANAERQHLDPCDVAEGAPGARANRIDELTWMWSVNDFREEQDFCLDRHVFDTTVDRRVADVMRAFDQHGVDGAELPGSPADRRGDRRVAGADLPK